MGFHDRTQGPQPRGRARGSKGTRTDQGGCIDYADDAALRIAVTVPGATPADPPQPLPADSAVQIEIVSGEGRLTWSHDVGGGVDVVFGTQILAFVDANGQIGWDWGPVPSGSWAGLSWDSQGSAAAPTELDTTIRVSLASGAGATAGFTIVVPPPPPPPPCCYA